MSFEPCASAELLRRTSLPSRRSARCARSTLSSFAAIALAITLLATLPHCGAFEDEPPPATAANAVQPADPNAPAPPDGPIPPAGQAGAPGAPDGPTPGAPTDGDDSKYVSGEYAIGTDTDSYDDNDPSALNDFRQPLDPYGSWADDPTYGTVWVPSPGAVGPDFQPYVSGGHWAYDDDYVWVSDYPWGWAPFHYGRWIFIEGRGWSWIPGREYRGAWVAWSVDDGYSYLGWAPMGPSFVWFGGAAVGWHGYWGPRWAYCPRGDVFAPRVGAHVLVGPGAVAIAGRMRPYTVADVRVGGPPPGRLGYTAAQIPHATGAASVSHAEQFARPSTAKALGGSAPTRFEAAPATNVARQSAVTGVRSSPVAGGPGVSNLPRSSAGAPSVGRTQAAPVAGRASAPAVQGGAPAVAPAGGGYRPPAAASHGGAVHGGGHHR
jgi:hypothetical protein